ncbi:MAG: fibronectin type III domain-containing protein [Jiangellaceae bacterium]
MNKRASAVAATSTSLVVASTLLFGVGPAAAESDGPPDPPANMRVTDLQPESITVGWDPVQGATEYSLVLIPLEAFGNYERTKTDELSFTFDDLTWDLLYRVTVRAFVPSAYPNWWTDISTVTARTLLPDGYVPPSPPTNLRVERDANGDITQILWDEATGSFGPFIYRLHLESPELPEIDGVWASTNGTSVDADELPICDGCIFEPGQTLTMFVTATDRVPKVSPPSDPLTLVCCPL